MLIHTMLHPDSYIVKAEFTTGATVEAHFDHIEKARSFFRACRADIQSTFVSITDGNTDPVLRVA